MQVTTIRRAQRALALLGLVFGLTACTESGNQSPFDGLVTALREANAATKTAQADTSRAAATPSALARPTAELPPTPSLPTPTVATPIPTVGANAAPQPSQAVATDLPTAMAATAATHAKPTVPPITKPAEPAPDLAALQHQLDELQNRVETLTAENQRQMERLSLMTNGAIADMEQLFNSLRLELRTTPGSEPSAPVKHRRNGPATSQAVPSGQGGPFLPWPPKPNVGPLSSTDRIEPLLPDLKTLFLLHQVVRALPLSPPLDEAVVTGPFGYRRDPFNRRSAFHDGIDLQAPMRTPVYAAASGTVVAAGTRPAYGRVVEIDHGFGIHTRYAHLSALSVREGDHVEPHSLVGALGSSGRSASPHLHYEVLFNGRPHDPADLLVLATGIHPLR
jgi:murein DD-endopeptidase MepM/ murein hydrolase activator NlpD